MMYILLAIEVFRHYVLKRVARMKALHYVRPDLTSIFSTFDLVGSCIGREECILYALVGIHVLVGISVFSMSWLG